MKLRIFLLFIGACLFMLSCSDDTTEQDEIDEQLILDYMEENSIDATRHSSGIYYLITDDGSGGNPVLSSTITVRYTGYLLNGNVFDSSGSSPTELVLQNTIEGWQNGIPLVKSGGEILLLIPSSLAYGSNQVGLIPPNSVLIFEVELLGFF